MSCSNLFLNLNDPHQIIDKANTYHLSRKLLTVHANDRDTKYHKESNEFSIKCPQAYTNVQSLRLTEISFPQQIYNFSKKLNNNKFKLDTSNIEIDDGFYSPDELANAMTYKAAKNFKVIYNKPKSKFIIGNNQDFTLNHVEGTNCKTVIQPFRNDSNSFVKSGLLYDIGFDDIPNNAPNKTFDNEYWNNKDVSGINNYYESDTVSRTLDKQPIYMEIDKYNLYDELNVYPKGSNNTYNNFSNSSTNTAFVKIPPSFTENYNRPLEFDNALVFFDPPLQRLQSLKFKFRYHDGRLVDFGNQDVNFTLEINQLRNELPNKMQIRTPAGL